MRYRITSSNGGKNITIEDIKDYDERFRNYIDQDYRIYGRERRGFLSQSDFFKYLRKMILARDTVTKFEKKDDTLIVGWIKKVDGHILEGESVYELQEVDEAFKRRLDRYISLYNLVKKRTDRNVIERKENDPMHNVVFNNSLKLLKSFAKTGIVKDDYDKLTIAEIYTFLYENSDKANYFSIDESDRVRQIRALFLGFEAIIFLGVAIFLVCVSQLFPAVVILGLGSAFFHVAKDSFVPVGRDSTFKAALEEIENVYKLDYLKAKEYLIKHAQRSQDILDFIEEDMRHIKENKIGENHLQSFKDLGCEFVGQSVRDRIDGKESIDKTDYLRRLTDLEIEVYSENPRFGWIKGIPSVSSGDFFERLKYLGWTVDEIENDEFLKSIFLSIKGIMKKPYEGCEVEVASLIKLAVSYACPVCGKNRGARNRYALYKNIKLQIDKAIEYKMNTVVELERKAMEFVNDEEKSRVELSISDVHDREKIIELNPKSTQN